DPRTDFASYFLNFKGEDLDKSLYDKEEAYLGDKKVSIFLMSSAFFYRLVNIRFRGSNAIISIGTIEIENPIRRVTYYILDALTPFLFLLYDVDKLGAYFNNIKNVIVRQDRSNIPKILIRIRHLEYTVTYVGPLDYIVYNLGTNFISIEFRNYAEIIVSKVERAYAPLRRAYDILYNKIRYYTDKETIL
ncbi:hypothetical protein CSPAE12_03789, partial [Colletotrichum incanum]